MQFIDGYTFNFDYVGSRATGNGGGKYLLAGPGWKGEKPEGVEKVIMSDTDLALALYRTQLFGPGDLDNVKKIQAGYQVPAALGVSRSALAGGRAGDRLRQAAMTTGPAEDIAAVFRHPELRAAVLPDIPPRRSCMKRFATIGDRRGRRPSTPTSSSPEVQTAIEQGMADAWADLDDIARRRIDAGEVTPATCSAPREYLKGNYLYRMAGAALGIYGNSS